MYFFSPFLLILIFHPNLFSQAILPCPPTWIHVAQLDNCYFSAPQPSQWEFAEDYCRERESRMVSINNQEEANIVKAIFARENPSFLNWIGLRWNDTVGNFTWSNGNPMTYSEFLPNSDSEECVSWVLDETLDGWKSISCYYSQFFLCQKPAGGIKTVWHSGHDTGMISLGNYSEFEHITHIIQSDEKDSRILLQFDDFDTEKHRDFLTITVLKSGKLISKLSGTLEPGYTILAKSSEIAITFKSSEDSGNDHRGFNLTYRIISPLPVKIFTETFGIIASDNSHPFTFQNYQVNCQPNHHVSAKVIKIELGILDRLKLFNGDGQSEKLMNIRNGDKGYVTKTTKPSIFITYESISSNNHWELEYECIYDGNFGNEIEV